MFVQGKQSLSLSSGRWNLSTLACSAQEQMQDRTQVSALTAEAEVLTLRDNTIILIVDSIGCLPEPQT